MCGVGAYYLLKGRHPEFARRSLSGGLLVLAVGSVTALLTGHVHARITYALQPAKTATYEAQFETGRGDLTVFGWPDADARTTHYKVAVPGGYGLLLKEDPDATVVGLDRFRREDLPPLPVPFVSYRLMAGVGTYLIGLSVVAGYFRWRGTLFQKRWLLRAFVGTIFPALVANHAGWVATEAGRQPWIVHPPLAWTGGAPGRGTWRPARPGWWCTTRTSACGPSRGSAGR